MAIISTDIKWKQAEENSFLSSNGGKMVTADVTASLIPDIPGSDRQTGVTRYRKVFAKNEQSDVDGLADLSLLGAVAYLRHFSPAEDSIMLGAGTPVDTQGTMVVTNWAGIGTLDQDYSTGVSAISVEPEVLNDGFYDPSTIVIFKADDLTSIEYIAVTGASWNAGNSAWDLTLGSPISFDFPRAAVAATTYSTITSQTFSDAGANFGLDDSKVGLFARVTSGNGAGQIRRITSNTTTQCTLDYAWEATDMPDSASNIEIISTFVATCVDLGDIVASSANWDDSNNGVGGGTYDETTYPVEVFPANCTTEAAAYSGGWQIEFPSDNVADVRRLSDNALVVQGVNVSGGSGYLQVGTIGAYQWRINIAGFSGTWQNGDTITFDTFASASSVWMKVDVTAGIAAYSGNPWNLVLAGDTA